MNNGQITAEIISQLTESVGQNYIFTDEETRKNYGHDETEDYNFPPAVFLYLLTVAW